jgi:hypothetical protein
MAFSTTAHQVLRPLLLAAQHRAAGTMQQHVVSLETKPPLTTPLARWALAWSAALSGMERAQS